MKLAAVLIALTLGLLACSNTQNTASTNTVSAAAPEEVAAIPAGADGATVYQARCASCHGADLRGTDNGPSQLSIVYEPGHHGDAAYRSANRNGAAQHHWNFGPMPAIDGLTDADVESVIAYVRSEQERQGFER